MEKILTYVSKFDFFAASLTKGVALKISKDLNGNTSFKNVELNYTKEELDLIIKKSINKWLSFYIPFLKKSNSIYDEKLTKFKVKRGHKNIGLYLSVEVTYIDQLSNNKPEALKLLQRVGYIDRNNKSAGDAITVIYLAKETYQ